MKLIGNIVCTIAILTQILLSTGLLSHAPDCQASQPLVASASKKKAENIPEKADTPHHHCGCGHHHTTEQTNSSSLDNDLCEFTPPAPSHDCTCSPQKTQSYTLSDQLAGQKSKKHLLHANNETSSSSEPSFSQLSVMLLRANQSNAPPPQTHYLPHSDTRFTSIHLGVFLI